MNTMDTSLSMQTLQVLSSCSCLSSSSGLGSLTVMEGEGWEGRDQHKPQVKNDECVTTSYTCSPLTFFSSGRMCSHSGSAGALPHLWLWRAQTRQSKRAQPKHGHHHKHPPLLPTDTRSDARSKAVQQLERLIDPSLGKKKKKVKAPQT